MLEERDERRLTIRAICGPRPIRNGVRNSVVIIAATIKSISPNPIISPCRARTATTSENSPTWARTIPVAFQGVRSRIVADLRDAGYLSLERQGRRNYYHVHTRRPMRHRVEGHCLVSELLGAIQTC
jgi:hypothetical protein